MKIKDLMTASNIRYCTPSTKLVTAVKSMRVGNCGALPVVDNESRVVGIVTDRDIAMSLEREHSGRVSEVMSREVQSVHITDEVNDVLRVMRKHQVGRVPVTTNEGRLVGIVSVHDLLTAQKHHQVPLGHVDDEGESLLRTIHSITSRYSYHPSKTMQKTPEIESAPVNR